MRVKRLIVAKTTTAGMTGTKPVTYAGCSPIQHTRAPKCEPRWCRAGMFIERRDVRAFCERCRKVSSMGVPMLLACDKTPPFSFCVPPLVFFWKVGLRNRQLAMSPLGSACGEREVSTRVSGPSETDSQREQSQSVAMADRKSSITTGRQREGRDGGHQQRGPKALSLSLFLSLSPTHHTHTHTHTQTISRTRSLERHSNIQNTNKDTLRRHCTEQHTPMAGTEIRPGCARRRAGAGRVRTRPPRSQQACACGTHAHSATCSHSPLRPHLQASQRPHRHRCRGVCARARQRRVPGACRAGRTHRQTAQRLGHPGSSDLPRPPRWRCPSPLYWCAL
jgi:hypothetical protein